MTEVGKYSSSEIARVIGGNVVCVGALNSLSLYEQRVKVFLLSLSTFGEMAEWSNVAVSKSVVP